MISAYDIFPGTDDVFNGVTAGSSVPISQVVTTGAQTTIAKIEQYGAQQLMGLPDQNLAAIPNPTAPVPTPATITAPMGTTAVQAHPIQDIFDNINQGTFFTSYKNEIIGTLAIIIVIKLLA